MFTFGKKKANYDLIGKLVDQQGAILKIVEDQREMIKELQETITKLQESTKSEN